MDQRLTAILPCNDLDAAQSFFERLGFKLDEGSLDEYRMLSDGLGGYIHLNAVITGWLQAGRNRSGCTSIVKMLMALLPLSRAKSSGRSATSRGACMSLLSMDLTKHWFAWVGRLVSAKSSGVRRG